MSLLKKRLVARMKLATRSPLWKGPEEDGVTYSMLTRFLSCRERFRVAYMVGLRSMERFNHLIEYGQMWHACEEALAAKRNWKDEVRKYAQGLAEKFPQDRKEIDHWLLFAYVQFPIYVDNWKHHADVKGRTPLFQEQVFDVKYLLPSGRTVRLRGKWDSVDFIGDGVWLQENKTKSAIDDIKIRRQLKYDLQTMLYLLTIRLDQQNVRDQLRPDGTKPGKLHKYADAKIVGVRYNVVRRSMHKSVESFTKKLTEDAADNRLGEWFGRWEVKVSDTDVKRFENRTLVPILENLCDWYEQQTMTQINYVNKVVERARKGHVTPTSWQHPFGSVNQIDEYGASDVDSYLATGSMSGLHRVDELFTELKV